MNFFPNNKENFSPNFLNPFFKPKPHLPGPLPWSNHQNQPQKPYTDIQNPGPRPNQVQNNAQNNGQNNGQNHIMEEFGKLKEIFEAPNFTQRFFNPNRCLKLYRYTNIPLYADTCATTDGHRPNCGNFIHANSVPIPSDPNRPIFVAMQAPLPSTLPSFFALMFRLAVPIVFTILQNKEITPNQPDYWSEVNYDGYLPNTGYKLNGQLEGKYRSFTQRRVVIIDAKNRKYQPFYHFHIYGWPDGMAPPPELHRPLLHAFRAVRDLGEKGFGPAVVHCSAGIGRTGTFIVGYFIYLIHWEAQKQKRNPTTNIFELTCYARSYRPLLVASPMQYAYLHAFNERLRSENLL